MIPEKKTRKKPIMNFPKISVIIPIYNSEEYLQTCLDSVIDQTLKEIEIICVNDGSTDQSIDILREYEKKEKRVLVINQENKGAGAARNNGMRYASGEFLSFLDADDFFEPQMLQTAYDKALNECDDIVVWRSNNYIQDLAVYIPNDNTIDRSLLPAKEPFAGIDISKGVFNAFIGWPWDKLFRSEFIRKKGLKFQEQRTSNDLLFVYSSIIAAERISTLEDIFAHHRILKSGKSLSNSRELSWDCFYKALLALRGQLEDWNLYSRFEQDFINYSLLFSIWNLETIRGNVFFQLYNELKNKWFTELGIMDKQESYFYSERNYHYLSFIKEHDAADFLFFILENMDSSMKGLQYELNLILHSKAWKIGSLITLIPGTIKRKFYKKKFPYL